MAELTGPPSLPRGLLSRLRGSSPRLRRVGRIAAGVTVLVATAAVVGIGPFLQGIASISPLTILAAAALTAVATVAAAWRWRIVAAGFGLSLAWSAAFAGYYRSQFLNVVLPGGVVGDVHRAVAHGRDHGRVDLAARAVAAERIAGQLVQLLLTLAILLPLGLASSLAPLVLASGFVALVVVGFIGALAGTVRGRLALRRELRMLRPVLSRPLTVLAIVVASTVVVAAHALTFIVAALAVGVSAGVRELGLLALLVLAASAIPLNVGGWGPREAIGASAFALVGLGAAAGVAVSTAFGVLVTVAVAPGALVLLADRFRSQREGRMIGTGRSV